MHINGSGVWNDPDGIALGHDVPGIEPCLHLMRGQALVGQEWLRLLFPGDLVRERVLLLLGSFFQG